MIFKKIIKQIADLKKTSRGRGILFFGVYFIFFVVLIIILQFQEKRPFNSGSYDYSDKYTFSLDNIEKANYKYNYKIMLDDNVYTLVGQRSGNKELFVVNNKNYYRNQESYFTLEGNLWIKSVDPNEFSYLIDTDNLKDMIENAYYLSRTDYDSGKEVFTFLISTNKIVELTENINIDISSNASEIIVSTDEEGNVVEIKLKLDSYCIYKKRCLEGLEIILDYDNFGEVLDIESPV